MKNFMVVDGAANSTFDVFSIEETTFALVFPEGQNIAFIDEVESRVDQGGLDRVAFFAHLYSNRQDKVTIHGLHGLLHSSGSSCDREYFPSRRESDIPGKR